MISSDRLGGTGDKGEVLAVGLLDCDEALNVGEGNLEDEVEGVGFDVDGVGVGVGLTGGEVPGTDTDGAGVGAVDGSSDSVADGSAVSDGMVLVHSPDRDSSSQSSKCTVPPGSGGSRLTEVSCTACGATDCPLTVTVSSSNGTSAGKAILIWALSALSWQGIVNEVACASCWELGWV